MAFAPLGVLCLLLSARFSSYCVGVVKALGIVWMENFLFAGVRV